METETTNSITSFGESPTEDGVSSHTVRGNIKELEGCAGVRFTHSNILLGELRDLIKATYLNPFGW